VPATVAVLGVIALVLFAASNWIRDRLVAADQTRLDALVEIQLSVTTVHLWLEEFVTGDEVDLSEIADGLQRATDLNQTLIAGGIVGEIEFELPPLPAGPARDAAIATRALLGEFADITARRQRGIADGGEVGIGSELDTHYDRTYDALIDAVRIEEAATRGHLAERAVLARYLGHAILITWLALIVFAVTGLWALENRRRRAEESLHNKEHQLLQSQKMDAVGRLAGGITHDINNYLAAITTNCELVQLHAEPGDPIAKKMDAVLRVCAKITALIKQLLAFSRQQPARRESVDLNALIGDLDAMLAHLIGEDVRLVTKLKPDLWSTHIDPSQAEQILINLVINARQAMQTGGMISIETDNAVLDAHYAAMHLNVAPGEYVLLSVSDTGHGIEQAIQDRIFEPFFTTKGKATNSGLGLSTIYGNVVQNNGHIRVYSKPGQGATFKIYLPRVARESGLHDFDDSAPQSANAMHQGEECILLVEDNDEFRRSARALLEELGYRVLVESDGHDALQTYTQRRHEIDLVLTDVVMPGMNGRELADAVRAAGGTAPVIFMSGHTTDVILDRGLLDGEARVLHKPFTARNLSEQLRDLLAGGPGAGGRPRQESDG